MKRMRCKRALRSPAVVPYAESFCASSWPPSFASPQHIPPLAQSIRHYALGVDERPPQLRVGAELRKRAL